MAVALRELSLEGRVDRCSSNEHHGVLWPQQRLHEAVQLPISGLRQLAVESIEVRVGVPDRERLRLETSGLAEPGARVCRDGANGFGDRHVRCWVGRATDQLAQRLVYDRALGAREDVRRGPRMASELTPEEAGLQRTHQALRLQLRHNTSRVEEEAAPSAEA